MIIQLLALKLVFSSSAIFFKFWELAVIVIEKFILQLPCPRTLLQINIWLFLEDIERATESVRACKNQTNSKIRGEGREFDFGHTFIVDRLRNDKSYWIVCTRCRILKQFEIFLLLIHCQSSFDDFLLVTLSCLIKHSIPSGEILESIPVFHLFIPNCKIYDSQFNFLFTKVKFLLLLLLQTEEHAMLSKYY